MLHPTLTLDDIRRHVIIGLAADDELGELLVLKGGNALRLVHNIGQRASLDLDYSIGADLKDAKAICLRVENALSREFFARGYTVFDIKMTAKPRIAQEHDERPTWGGWQLEFKLIQTAQYNKLKETPSKLRDHSLDLYGAKKNFQIDISKYEYVDDAIEVTFGGYPLRVYSPAMIVYEKLRALCQQLPEYEYVSHPSPRPRDFVDICATLAKYEAQIVDERSIIQHVFSAKEVPLSWLSKLAGQKDFHEQAWTSVAAQLSGKRAFSSYFAEVMTLIKKLQALGIEQPPVA